jgi:hypothetical protein
MLYVHGDVLAACMFVLHVHTACPCCMSILHVHAASHFYISLLHVQGACQSCIVSAKFRQNKPLFRRFVSAKFRFGRTLLSGLSYFVLFRLAILAKYRRNKYFVILFWQNFAEINLYFAISFRQNFVSSKYFVWRGTLIGWFGHCPGRAVSCQAGNPAGCYGFLLADFFCIDRVQGILLVVLRRLLSGAGKL